MYGRVRFGRKSIGAHRASYMAFKGPISEGLWVLHSCDIRCCVNPYHLRLGTAADNAKDCAERWRNPRRAA